MERKNYNNITVITDGSYRAVQAHELARQLAKLDVYYPLQISCGLDVARIAAESDAPYKVSVLDPGQYASAFNMVIISSHEPHPPRANFFEITGLINMISPEFLEGREHNFGFGVAPVAVLVGGRHVGGNFSVNDAKRLADELNAKGKPALVTTSKRTEESAAKALRENIKVPHVFYDFNHDGQAANPYFAMLASCDEIIVTADSVRMVSEAASSGKKISIFTPEQVHFSYIDLREAVLASQLPLRESQRVAEIIKGNLIRTCKNNLIT